jgi:catechol 2,3-dioxygenase-like lactoylglutathione lyase family enzyme
MKREDPRADLLATALEGGPVAEEIESLLPAADRLRELLARLEPGTGHVSSLLPELYRGHLSRRRSSGLRLAHLTLAVRDTEAALRFYRDVLGFQPLSEGKWFSELEAGGAIIALRWTGSSTRLPQVGDVCVEFWSEDFDGAVEDLRQLGVPLALGRDRRGAYVELRDPDGHAIRLIGLSGAERSVRTRAGSQAASGDRDE